ncbi:hypothetical protein P9112_000003 [Eukaryota sp. TZLM1-RC]
MCHFSNSDIPIRAMMIHLTLLLSFCLTTYSTVLTWSPSSHIDESSFHHTDNWKADDGVSIVNVDNPLYSFVINTAHASVEINQALIHSLKSVHIRRGSLTISASTSIESFVWETGTVVINTPMFHIHSSLTLSNAGIKTLKGNLLLFGSLSVTHNCRLELEDSNFIVRHHHGYDNIMEINEDIEFVIENMSEISKLEIFVPLLLKFNSKLVLEVDSQFVKDVTLESGAEIYLKSSSEINGKLTLEGIESKVIIEGDFLFIRPFEYYSAIDNDIIVAFNFQNPPENNFFSDEFGNYYGELTDFGAQYDGNSLILESAPGDFVTNYRPIPKYQWSIYLEFQVEESLFDGEERLFGYENGHCTIEFGISRASYGESFADSITSSLYGTKTTYPYSATHAPFITGWITVVWAISTDQTNTYWNFGTIFYHKTEPLVNHPSCKRFRPLSLGYYVSEFGANKFIGKIREFRVYSRYLHNNAVQPRKSTITKPEISSQGSIIVNTGSTFVISEVEVTYDGDDLEEVIDHYTCEEGGRIILTGNIVVDVPTAKSIDLTCKITLQGSLTIVSGTVSFVYESQFDGTLIVQKGGAIEFEPGTYIFGSDSVLNQHPSSLITDSAVTLFIGGTLNISPSITYSGSIYVLNSNSKVKTEKFIIDTELEVTLTNIEFLRQSDLKVQSGIVVFHYDDESTDINLSKVSLIEGSLTFENGNLLAEEGLINAVESATMKFFNTELRFETFTSDNGIVEFDYSDDLTTSTVFILTSTEIEFKQFNSKYTFTTIDFIKSTRKGNGDLSVENLKISDTDFQDDSRTSCTVSCKIFNGDAGKIKVKDGHVLDFDGDGSIGDVIEQLLEIDVKSGSFILNKDTSFTTDSNVRIVESSDHNFQILGTFDINQKGTLHIDNAFTLEGAVNVNSQGSLQLDSSTDVEGKLNIFENGHAEFKGDIFTFKKDSTLSVHPGTLTLEDPISLVIEGTYEGDYIEHSDGQLTFDKGSTVDTSIFKVTGNGKLKFIDANFDGLTEFSSTNGDVEFDYDEELNLNAEFTFEDSTVDFGNDEVSFSFQEVEFIASTRKGNGDLSVENLRIADTDFRDDSRTSCTVSCKIFNGDTGKIKVKDGHVLDFDGDGRAVNVNSQGSLQLDSSTDVEGKLNIFENGHAEFKGDIFTFKKDSTLSVHPGTLTLEDPISLVIEGTYEGDYIEHSDGQLTFDKGSTVDTSIFKVTGNGKLKFIDANFDGLTEFSSTNGDVEFDYDEELNLNAEFTFEDSTVDFGNDEVSFSFQEVEFIASTRKGNGDLSVENLRIADTDFRDDSRTSCTVSCKIFNGDTGKIKVKDGHVLDFDGDGSIGDVIEQLLEIDVKSGSFILNKDASFTTDSNVRIVESSDLNFQILGTFDINQKGTLHIDNAFTLEGAVNVNSQGSLQLDSSTDVEGKLNIFENGHAEFKGDIFTFKKDSTLSVHPGTLTLEDPISLVIEGTYEGDYIEHSVGQLTFDKGSTVDTSIFKVTGNGKLKFIDANFDGLTEFSSTNGDVEFDYDEELNLNVEFTFEDSTVDFGNDEVSFSFQEVEFIASTRKGNGDLSVENLRISDTDFRDDSRTSCTVSCKIFNGDAGKIKVKDGHVLDFDGDGSIGDVIEQLLEIDVKSGSFILNKDTSFTTDSTVRIVESSDLNFQILGTFDINQKGTLHIDNAFTLEGAVNVNSQGSLQLDSSTDVEGKLNIFENGHAEFKGDIFTFKKDSTLSVHPGTLTLEDPISLVIEGTYEGDYIEHSDGQLTFDKGSTVDTSIFKVTGNGKLKFIDANFDGLTEFSSTNGDVEFDYDEELNLNAEFTFEDSTVDFGNDEVSFSFQEVEFIASTRKGNGDLSVENLRIADTDFRDDSRTSCTVSCKIFNGDAGKIKVKDGHVLDFDGDGSIGDVIEQLLEIDVKSGSFILNKDTSFTTDSTVRIVESSDLNFQILGTFDINQKGTLHIDNAFTLEGAVNVNSQGSLQLDSSTDVEGKLNIFENGHAEFKGDIFTFKKDSTLSVHPGTLTLEDPISLVIEGTYEGDYIEHSDGQLTFDKGSTVDTSIFKVTGNGKLKFIDANFDGLTEFSSTNGDVEKGNGDLSVENLRIADTDFRDDSRTSCTVSCKIFNGDAGKIKVKDGHVLDFDGDGSIGDVIEQLLEIDVKSGSFILNKDTSFTTDSNVRIVESSDLNFQILGTFDINQKGTLHIDNAFTLEGAVNVNSQGSLQLDSSTDVEGKLNIFENGHAEFKGDIFTFKKDSTLSVHPGTLTLEDPISLVIEGTYEGDYIEHSVGQLTFDKGSTVDTSIFKVTGNGKLKFIDANFDGLTEFSSTNGDVEFDYDEELNLNAEFTFEDSTVDFGNDEVSFSFQEVEFIASTRKGNGDLSVENLRISDTDFRDDSRTSCTVSCIIFNGDAGKIKVKDGHVLDFDGDGSIGDVIEQLLEIDVKSGSFILNKDASFTTDSNVRIVESSDLNFQILGTFDINQKGTLHIDNAFTLEGAVNVNSQGSLQLDSSTDVEGKLNIFENGHAEFKGDIFTFKKDSTLSVHPGTLTLEDPISLVIEGTYEGDYIEHSVGQLTFDKGSTVDTSIFKVTGNGKLKFIDAYFDGLTEFSSTNGDVEFDYDEELNLNAEFTFEDSTVDFGNDEVSFSFQEVEFIASTRKGNGDLSVENLRIADTDFRDDSRTSCTVSCKIFNGDAGKIKVKDGHVLDFDGDGSIGDVIEQLLEIDILLFTTDSNVRIVESSDLNFQILGTFDINQKGTLHIDNAFTLEGAVNVNSQGSLQLDSSTDVEGKLNIFENGHAEFKGDIFTFKKDSTLSVHPGTLTLEDPISLVIEGTYEGDYIEHSVGQLTFDKGSTVDTSIFKVTGNGKLKFIDANFDGLTEFSSTNGDVEFDYDEELNLNAEFTFEDSTVDFGNDEVSFSFQEVEFIASTRKGNGDLSVENLRISDTDFRDDSRTSCTVSCKIFNGDTGKIKVKDGHVLDFDGDGSIGDVIEQLLEIDVKSGSFILNKDTSFTTDSNVRIVESSDLNFQILGTFDINQKGTLHIDNAFTLEGAVNVNSQGSLQLDSSTDVEGKLNIFENGHAEFKGDIFTFKKDSTLSVHPGTLTLEDPISLVIEGTYEGDYIEHSVGQLTFDKGSTVDTSIFKVTGNGKLKFIDANFDGLTEFSSTNGDVEFDYDEELNLNAEFTFEDSTVDFGNDEVSFSFQEVEFIASTRKGNGDLSVENLKISDTDFQDDSRTSCTVSCKIFNGDAGKIKVKDGHVLDFDGDGSIGDVIEQLLEIDVKSGSFILNKDTSFTTDSNVRIVESSDHNFQILGTFDINQKGTLHIDNAFTLEGAVNVNSQGSLQLDSSTDVEGKLNIFENGHAEFKGDIFTFKKDSTLSVHPGTLTLEDPISLVIEGTYEGDYIEHSVGQLTFDKGSTVDTSIFKVTGNGKLKFIDANFDGLTEFSSTNGDVEFDYDEELNLNAEFTFEDSTVDFGNDEVSFSFQEVEFIASTRKGNGDLSVENLRISDTVFVDVAVTSCTVSCTFSSGILNQIQLSSGHEIDIFPTVSIQNAATMNFLLNNANLFFFNSVTLSSVYFFGLFDSEIKFTDSQLNHVSFVLPTDSNSLVIFEDTLICDECKFEWSVEIHGSFCISKGSSKFLHHVIFDSIVTINPEAYLIINSFAMFTKMSVMSYDQGLITSSSAVITVAGTWIIEGGIFDANNVTFTFTESSSFVFDFIHLQDSTVIFYTFIEYCSLFQLNNSQVSVYDISSSFTIEFLSLGDSNFVMENLNTNVTVVDVSMENSTLSLVNIDEFLYIETLNTIDSDIVCNSGNLCVIGNSSSLDSNFFEYSPFLFLSDVDLNIDLNDGSTCCPTSSCSIMVSFELTSQVSNFLEFSFMGATAEWPFPWVSDTHFGITIIDLHNVEQNFEFFYFSVGINTQFLLISSSLPICPLTITDVSRPITSGDSVTISGENFGISDFFITIDIPTLNIFVNTTDHDHYSLTFSVGEGAGCHNFTLIPQNRPHYYTSFCYGVPFIEYFAPLNLPFSSDFVINGYNFGVIDSFEIEFSNVLFSYELFSVSYSFAILNINYLCTFDIESEVEMVVFAGGQSSNSIKVPLTVPTFKIFPDALPFSGGSFIIEGYSFGNLFQYDCLPHADVSCDDADVTFAPHPSHPNRLDVDISNLTSNITTLNCFLILSPFINSSFSVSIATIGVAPMDGICFVETKCKITVFGDVDFSSLVPQVYGLELLNYQANIGQGVIDILPFLSSPTLELCSRYVCFPVSRFPAMATVISFAPKAVPFSASGETICLEMMVSNSGFYSSFTNAFSFSDFDLTVTASYSDVLNVCFVPTSVGIFPLNIHSLYSTKQTDLYLEVFDPFSLPTLLTGGKSHIFFPAPFGLTLRMGSLFYDINPGYNTIDLEYIKQCPTVVEVIDGSSSRFLIADCFESVTISPQELLVAHPSFFDISLPTTDAKIDVDCLSDDCEILSLIREQSTLRLYLNILIPGRFALELTIAEYEHFSKKQFELIAFEVPQFIILSPTEFFLYQNASIKLIVESSISSLSFYWNSTEDTANCREESFGLFTIKFIYLPHLLFQESTALELLWGNAHFDYHSVVTFNVYQTNITSLGDSLISISTRNYCMHISFYLPNFSLNCLIDQMLYSAIIDGDTLCCLEARSVQVTPMNTVLLVDNFGNILDSLDTPVEPIFTEDCFVQNSFSSIVLSSSNFVIDKVSDNVEVISDGFRCCRSILKECSLLLPLRSNFSINFDNGIDLRSVTITIDSDCESTSGSFPLDFVYLDASWNCHSIPNGFRYALQCTSIFSSTIVDSISLFSDSKVYILEVEVNGFDPFTCHEIVDFESGLTSLGNVIPIDTVVVYENSVFFTVENLLYEYSNNSNVFLPSLSFDLELYSSSCLISTSDYAFDYFPADPRSLIFLSQKVILEPSPVLVDVECRDGFGYVTNCVSASIDFVEKSLELDLLWCDVGTCALSLSTDYSFADLKLGDHLVTYTTANNDCVNEWRFSLEQEPYQYLTSKLIDVVPCQTTVTSSHACSLVSIEFYLNDVLPTSTQSFLIGFSLDNFVIRFSYVNGQILFDLLQGMRIFSPPRMLVRLDIEYNGLITTVEFTAADCVYPTVFWNNQCVCSPGYELNSAQTCSLCPLNTYANHRTDHRCIECPFNRITFHKGSSGIEDCECMKNFLLVDDSCVRCPNRVTCRFGNISSYDDGYLFGSIFEPTNCIIRHLCKNNTCLAGHYGSHCLDCIDGYHSFGVLCLQRSFGNFVISFAFATIFFVLLTLSAFFYEKVQKFNDAKQSALKQSLRQYTPSELKFVLKQKSFSFLLFLLCVSELFFHGISMNQSFIFGYLVFPFPRLFHWTLVFGIWFFVYIASFHFIYSKFFNEFPRFEVCTVFLLFFSSLTLVELVNFNFFEVGLVVVINSTVFVWVLNKVPQHGFEFFVFIVVFVSSLFVPIILYKCILIVVLLLTGIFSAKFDRFLCFGTSIFLVVKLTVSTLTTFS